MVKGLASSLLLAPLIASVSGKSTPLYKDANAPVEKRVKDLLGRMTIEDKMAQLMQGKCVEVLWRLFCGKLLICVAARRCHQLDELNIRRIQLYWACHEYGDESRFLLWYGRIPTHVLSRPKTKKFTVGYPVAWDWIADNIKRAQDYLLQNTTLGIPALVQTEGMYIGSPDLLCE